MDSRREHLRLTRALRRGLFAALTLAVLGPLAGCGGSTSTTGSAATAAGFSCPNNGTVRMGVEPYDDAAKLLPVLRAVAQQLGSKLGCTVELTVATNYTAEIEAMRNGRLEIGEFGPLGYVLAHQVARARSVATYTDRSGAPATYTASIVSPQGSGLTRLADVAGHSFAYSDAASTSGHLFPAYALKRSGIDPDSGVQALYAGSHTASFEAIRNRKVDAGELNSNTITSATASGEYRPSDFVTLWQSDPIPQDPICVRGDLPAAFTRKLTTALAAIDLSSVPDPGKVLLGNGFTAQPDSAYDTIRDLVSTLKLDLNNLPK